METHYKVRCKRCEDGTHNLFYGKGNKQLAAKVKPEGSIFIVGLPGLSPFRGKLREVKEKWGRWAVGVYHGELVPCTPRAEPSESDWAKVMQERIDSAETMEDAVKLYVNAYNSETVSLSAAKHLGSEMTRHEYRLPPKWQVLPRLEDTFDVTRQQYVWPNVVSGATATYTQN